AVPLRLPAYPPLLGPGLRAGRGLWRHPRPSEIRSDGFIRHLAMPLGTGRADRPPNSIRQLGQLHGAEILERDQRFVQGELLFRETVHAIAVPAEFPRAREDRSNEIVSIGDRIAAPQSRAMDRALLAEEVQRVVVML